MSIEKELARFSPPKATVLAIGTFDGVHLGHQYVLRRTREEARSRGWLAGVLTFHNHPRTVLIHGTRVEYLCSLEERKSLIKAQGVDLVIGFDFTQELSRIKAREFVSLLMRHLKMGGLVVGPDFALGHRREGDIPTLTVLGEAMGFFLRVVEPEVTADGPVRSRVLRKVVTAGDVEGAARMLGRPFSLTGRVVEGDRRGRALGFPTANLEVPPELAIPADGIYATWTLVRGQRYQSATSIGTRPTFGPGPRTVETFILDFDDDIYGETITVEFARRLREELPFTSEAALIEQMNRDVAQARALLSGSRR